MLAALASLGFIGCNDDVPGYFSPSDACSACTSNQVCQDNTCLDKCGDTVCSAEQMCIDGTCQDKPKCGDTYCDNNQTCVNDVCVDKAKCGDTYCETTQICIDNKTCMDTICGSTRCVDGQVCHENACIDPKCIGVVCKEANQVCVAGSCQTNPCLNVTCNDGRVCQPTTGKCRYEGEIKVGATVTNSETDPTTHKPLTTEDGSQTAIVSIKLDHKPEGNVTIECKTNPATEATVDCSNIVFTPDNWDQPQTVTITGAKDDIVDGNQPYTVTITTHSQDDPQFEGLETKLDFTSVDTDKAEISVPNDVFKTSEAGESATIPVALTSKPTADVTITVTSKDITEGKLVDANGNEVESITLTFTPDNWNTHQNVVVKGQPDQETDGNVDYNVSLQSQSQDPNFDGKEAAIHLQNKDSEPGIVVTPANTDDLQEGGTKIYNISLNTRPEGNVTISIEGTEGDVEICLVETDQEGNITIKKDETGAKLCSNDQSIVISPDAFDDGVNIAVKAPDDDVINETQKTFEVEVSVDDDNTNDDKYKEVADKTISGNIEDTDKAGVKVIPTPDKAVSEDGIKQTTLLVSLLSKPKNDVDVAVAIADPSEIKIVSIDEAPVTDAVSLKFTSETWTTEKEILITGVIDNIIDGDIISKMTFTPSSEDKNFQYDETNNKDVQASIDITTIDVDKAGFVVGGLAEDESMNEKGGSKDYTFNLSAKPENPVTVTISVTANSDRASISFPNISADKYKDNGDGTYSIIIDPENWNTPIDVHVEAKDNDMRDGDQPFNIQLKASSEDKNFDEVKGTQTITINDDDSASITIPKLVTFDMTGSETITVKLSSKPLQDTTITIDDGSGTPKEIVFKKDDDEWKNGKEITIETNPEESDNYNGTLTATVKSGGDDYNNVTQSFNIDVIRTKQYQSSNCQNHRITLTPGKYKLQVWGASGGDGYTDYVNDRSSQGGLGGYAEGILTVLDGEEVTLNVIAGGQGKEMLGTNASSVECHSKSMGCNGGGAGCGTASSPGFGGGGASDMRIADKNSTDKPSLYARIIVAGGGGGADNPDPSGGNDGSGGYGGGLEGGLPKSATDGIDPNGYNGTQTNGYEFGKGQSAYNYVDIGGGGGGWFGGKAYVVKDLNANMGGGGGSGFVYTKDSTATIEAINKINPTKQYSVDAKYQLTEAKTIAGDKTVNIPVHGNYLGSTAAKDLMAGNKGDGFARITRLTK